MPTFKYQARDRDGQLTAGSLQAADERDLRRILRANEMYLTRYRAADRLGTAAMDGSRVPFFAPRPNLQDMTIAMRQLASTLRAGLPIIESLEIVGSQSGKPALESAFGDLRQGVADGQFLSAEMRRHPRVFNRLTVALVEAGEAAGTLDQTLDAAADGLNREDELRMRVKAATTYPKLVVLACAGTIAGMLLIVVPVFSRVYEGLHAPLPASTRLLMALSGATVHAWWAFVLLGAGLVFASRRFAETGRGRRTLDRLALRVPSLGPVLRKVAIARFVQTLAGALRGGVPVLTSLEISAETAGNTVIRDAIRDAAENVRDGASIAGELERTGQFPRLVTQMIAAGESTGGLDAMLEEISRFYERDVDFAVDRLTRLIEPLMTILVGGIVLLALLALYMPIFSLGSAFLGKK